MTTVAYLINQYPKISHSFIRREILGVEAAGLQVCRFAVRGCPDQLVDPADQQELSQTRVILQSGVLQLVWQSLIQAMRHPQRFWQAFRLTVQIGWRSERGLLIHFAYLLEACLLLHWLKAAQVVHLHAHFGTNPAAVAMLCRVLGGPPYSFTIHGPEEFDRVRELALIEKVERAAFVVTVSSFGKSQLYRWCSLDQWPKIQVIHCGVDQSFLNCPLQPVPSVPRLVCIGRLSEQKGHLLLLQAVSQLVRQGIKLQLVLVGDGPLRQEVEQLIQQLELQPYVTITGWASNAAVQQEILQARALVLPSFAEGLPVVLMEALALGRPVVSTYIAGIPELVIPTVCGWLVPAGSITELASTLALVLDAPAEVLTQMGKAGYMQVQQFHDAGVEAAKLARLFLADIAVIPSPRN